MLTAFAWRAQTLMSEFAVARTPHICGLRCESARWSALELPVCWSHLEIATGTVQVDLAMGADEIDWVALDLPEPIPPRL